MYSYSRRLPWSLSANTLTRLAQQKREVGAKLIDLTISNPTEVFEDYPQTDIARAYHAIQDFRYYPDPFGSESARLAISGYYASRGVAVSPQRLLLTASTSEAYVFLFKLFCNPGDEIVAPAPSYPLFEYLASLESVRIKPYRLRYDGSWFLDIASLRQSLSPRTRAIILVNPNNPTGSFLKKQEAHELFQIVEERCLPIISDEVFTDYSFGSHPERLQTLIGNDSALTFSLNGLSKTAGMPQMKLAWIAISGRERDCELARQRLELIGDTYLSVATPVQSALSELLRIGDAIRYHIANRTAQNLTTLRTMLQHTPAHVLHVEGGWSAIIQLPATCNEETWTVRLLNEHNVLVQPGYFFDLESEPHLVVSLITPSESFVNAIHKLAQTLS